MAPALSPKIVTLIEYLRISFIGRSVKVADKYLVFVSSEQMDIRLNPFQGSSLIMQSQIERSAIVGWGCDQLIECMSIVSQQIASDLLSLEGIPKAQDGN